MGIVKHLAEGVNSVIFQTSRMGQLSTGFNLTISDTLETEHDGEISVGIEGDRNLSKKLGSKKGIILSDGTELSRTHHGRTTVVVDPIMDLLKKSIIVNNTMSYLEKEIGEAVKDPDFIVTLTVSEVEGANTSLREGDVAGFINVMFGLSDGTGTGVEIRTDKAKESPIIRDLSEIASLAANSDGARGSFFTALSTFSKGGLYTVESIFQQTLGPLGLELYWVKDNIYSLEPPRLTNPKAEALPIQIDKDDIVKISSTVDPYNVPDIIIPSTVVPDVVGVNAASVLSQNALKLGVLSDMSGKRSMKIQTYDIPNFLINPITMAIKVSAENINNVNAPLKELTSEDAIKYYSTFFGSSARKSQLYKLTRGGCTLKFRPDITEPFSWYTIDETEYFITDIRHTVTRSSAETILTIGGKRNETHEIESKSPSIDSKIKDTEDAFLNKIQITSEKEVDKVNDAIKEIKQKVDRNSPSFNGDDSYLAFSGGNISKDGMNVLFGNDNEMLRVIESTKAVDKTNKGA